MKKIILFIFLLFSLLIMADVSISVGFSIYFGNFQDIPEYSILINVGEPLIDVYVDGVYAGKTDVFGSLLIKFSSAGYHTITLEGEYYLKATYNFYVDKEGTYLNLPLQPAGKLTIFSNVYPVEIYGNGIYFGKVYSLEDSIKIPVGTFNLIFSSPGYENATSTVTINFQESQAVEVNFIPKKLKMYIRSKNNSFSPNGDWYNDKWQVEIFLSTYATVTITIVNDNNKIVYFYTFRGKPNLNIFTWDGSNVSDGNYKVIINSQTENESKTVETYVSIDRSNYTYLKEITLSFITVFFGYLLYSIFQNLQ
ncbi:PEGA domain-containing protein [Thermosipho ferrireducens]|uniref:PEGA domain-containing protein n=1 Tax=Thermosipho ferrireducens TaxID=2571116 RepID=A0ABX7S5P9_9BACT|nr:PEGA domain-containing protein [Thermosipho ferrireducens]QTA37888.1 PEGA domain-containing protein [Thermosipho ferrireducens]